MKEGGRSFPVRRWKSNDETGAGWRVVAVLHFNLPVMAFDDCPGNRKPKTRMAAEIFLFRPF
jgi:hypothetical protein